MIANARFAALSALSLVAAAAVAGEVRFADTTTVLPTYLPGGFDKTPVFYTGRVYQGAQGRAYPYPMQDVLFDERRDEPYRCLTLENDWLSLGILPEHGGHLLYLTDRKTGFETFYRQHVIKPALIGMTGAWISGGVEWNFPHHHRATSAMPVDWRETDRTADVPGEFVLPAGSKTIWLGETEFRRRLKWTIGLSLLPDRAVLVAENAFMNRGPFVESMLYWANVAVSCGEDYQVLFPPDCHLGYDHHKRFWTDYPTGLLDKHDRTSPLVDLSWWKNFTFASRSIFAMDPDNAWLAGYDHAKNAGTAHVSNRHITVGKKFFLWGNFPKAQMWDSIVLTDTDGPYLELMVGCWSDNQPDYSWIAPYETRRVKQFWFPVKGIGGVKNVTVDGAVNVDRRGKEKLLVGFHSTRVLENCTVKVTRKGEAVFEEKGIAIDPNTPWCRSVAVPADAADCELTAAIADADGKVFLSYAPAPERPHGPLPPDVAEPQDPKSYASAELAYLTGLRLEQFHNGVVDPLPYYERALEIDPSYSRANLACGIRLLKAGRAAEARTHLEKAVARVTQNYTRANDAEPEYYLALCFRALADETAEASARTVMLKRAEDLFWRCTWRATVKKEALVEIVRICCLGGRYREARDILEFEALPLAANEAKLHTLHAFIHRKLGALEPAAKDQAKAFACDPLEYWGLCEAAFRANRGETALADAERDRGLKAQQLMETLCDYGNLGAWDEVVALCDQALARAAAERPYRSEGPLPIREIVACCDSYRLPMFAYFKAFAQAARGEDEARVSATLADAERMAGDYCFPSRLEELAVLRWATARKDAGANAFHYLGEVLWHLDRKNEAVVAWRRAERLASDHALVLRNLGFALTHPGTYFDSTGVPAGVANAEGAAFYRRAIDADRENPRTLVEADTAFRRTGVPAAERLALLESRRATVDRYDPCVVRLVELYLETGAFDAAARILSTRHFHIWEGSGTFHDLFVKAHLGRGERKLAAGDFAGARRDFETALTYPVNLEAAHPNDAGTDPQAYWALARCAKAAGDADACRAALEKAVVGKTDVAEMNVYRAFAYRELGDVEAARQELSAVRKAIAELEKPQPRVPSAYVKFGGEESPDERAAARNARLLRLRKDLLEVESTLKAEKETTK